MHDTRLSIGLNLFTAVPADEAIQRAAKCGFGLVELLADAPHLWPVSPQGAQMDAVDRALQETGVGVANVNANTVSGLGGPGACEPWFEPSLANPRKELREWRLRCIHEAIDIAARVGAPSVCITAGRPHVPLERARDRLERSLDEVALHAESRGVRVGIEYEPGLLVENAQELTRLLDRVGSPWIGANLDVAHVWVNREDPVETIRALGPRIFHVHLADIRGRKHLHLLPGDGDIPFARVLDALDGAGYRGPLTAELYTYAHEPDATALVARERLAALRRQAAPTKENQA